MRAPLKRHLPANCPECKRFPSSCSFPDPFLMSNGKRVKTIGIGKLDGGELRELILGYEYGRMPTRTERSKGHRELLSRGYRHAGDDKAVDV